MTLNLRTQGDWVYAKVGEVELRGKLTPDGKDIITETITSKEGVKFDKDALAADKRIREFLGVTIGGGISEVEKEKLLAEKAWLGLPLRVEGEAMGEAGKCAAGLLELRNSIKREIQGEREASKRYFDASAKLTYYHFATGAQTMRKMSEDEFMHSYMAEAVVDYITEACGE